VPPVAQLHRVEIIWRFNWKGEGGRRRGQLCDGSYVFKNDGAKNNIDRSSHVRQCGRAGFSHCHDFSERC